MWTQILQEQSDLGPHCWTKRLLKHFSRRQKQMTFDVNDALRVNQQELVMKWLTLKAPTKKTASEKVVCLKSSAAIFY